jgi:hypothetical protein
MPQSCNRQTHGKRGAAMMARPCSREPYAGNAPFRGVGVEISAANAFHSFNRQNSRLIWRGAPRLMLDKVDGDMVHLRVNLRPPKANEAAGIIIHLLL